MVVSPEIWYDRAAEHQCVVAGVHHHFRLVGVLKLCVCAILGEWECQSGNVGGVVGEAVHYLPDLPRIYKRLVALYVDDHICIARQVVISLKAAVCSAAMVGGCHDCFCAESSDGLKDSDVISGHCKVFKHRGDACAYMLYHGFPVQVGERFPLEAGGGITRGDNSYELHTRESDEFCYPSDCIASCMNADESGASATLPGSSNPSMPVARMAGNSDTGIGPPATGCISEPALLRHSIKLM